jgi:hypothetical protein
LDDRGSVPGGGNDGIFSHRHRVKTGFGVHLSNGYRKGRLIPPRLKVDYSASSAEVKNAWSSTPIPNTSSWLGS